MTEKMIHGFSRVAVFLMTLVLTLTVLPNRANAASSSDIRKQINALKAEEKQIKEKIMEVQEQYKKNENEIVDIIARKNVIDQQIQLLTEEITNTNEQIASYNILIADKQDELDYAENRYEQLEAENRMRIRAMEEEGEVSYWEVLFRANSFSDLIDHLNIVEEIASADKRRMQELSDAKNVVGIAQVSLIGEKSALEEVKADLDRAEADLDEKKGESVALLQELLGRADELESLEQKFAEQEEKFLAEIAQKEAEFDEAKRREWEAFMATYVPPPVAPLAGNNSSGDKGNDGSVDGSTGSSGGSGWIVPCSYTSITSPFGYRKAPTAGASTYHQGVDLDTGTGWPVVASRAGVVTAAGWSNSAGYHVKINHQDGFSSIYMHLSSVGVSNGQIVSAGQYIGATGSTGISKGDHLHFGISQNGVYVNPCAYVGL